MFLKSIFVNSKVLLCSTDNYTHYPTISPLNSKEIKPVNPKGNQPQYSLERRMLKLNLQYVGYLMRRTDSLEKILMLGKIEGRRRRGQQKMRWLDERTLGDGEGQRSLEYCNPWGHKKSDTTEELNNNNDKP